MTSPAAIQPGNFYHIYNRGNNGANIFIEERNYRFFLLTYASHVSPIADTYAYCLLRNHFHLLVRVKVLEEMEVSFRTKKPGQIFGNFLNAYAKSMNNTYEWTGSLFEHPFKRVLIRSDTQFARLVVYIHQNPQKHGFVKDFRAWPYSSYLALGSQKPSRLQRQEVIKWFGNSAGFEKAHQSEISEHQISSMVPLDLE